MFSCAICSKSFNQKDNMQRHINTIHNGEQVIPKTKYEGYGKNFKFVPEPKLEVTNNMHDGFDIRLKENFKLFISGPSRCGKTVFVSKLLENIHTFAKLPPSNVIYVYKVWQPKYDEIKTMGVNFMEDNNNNIVDDIKSTVSGQSILVIFDDLIGC